MTESVGGHADNCLSELPRGIHRLGGVEFQIDDRMLRLGSCIDTGWPMAVEGIEINHKLTRLHFLHGTTWGGGAVNSIREGEQIAEYSLHYEDGSTATVPVL